MSLYYFVIVNQMLRKPHPNKISGCKLIPITQPLQNIDDNLQNYLLTTIKTPKHSPKYIQQLETIKTQKLNIYQQITVPIRRQPLPSLKKIQTGFKENLLDLDLCFAQTKTRHCQTDRIGEKHDFVIRKVRNQSISSYGRETSAGSSQNSVEEMRRSDCHAKNTTDQSKIFKDELRVKTHSKYTPPSCKIVQTKKLPFNIGQPSHKKRVQVDQLNWSIQIIPPNNCELIPLLSSQSFKQLFPCF